MFLRSSSKSGVGQGWRPHQIQTRNRPKPGPRKHDLIGVATCLGCGVPMPRRRIRPLLMWHRLQRAESFRASSPTSRYGARFKTPHQNPQSLTHLRGRQSDRRCGRQSEGIKHPNRRGTRDSRLTKTRRWLRERRPRHTKRPARNQMTGGVAPRTRGNRGGAERKGKAKRQDHDLSRQRQGEAFA